MTKTLLIVDPRVHGYQQWLPGINLTSTVVLVLETSLDGLTQIADYVGSRGAVYSAIHIVSHGSEGALYLGSTTLTQSNIESYATQLGMMGQGLTDDGDILLYGCDVATGVDGDLFIRTLAVLTGAEVAASTDVSGPVALGGDGALESKTGSIEAAVLDMESLSSVLAVNSAPTFTLGDGIVNAAISEGSSDGSSVTVQADGKILVAGNAAISIGTNPDFALVRYNTDGTLDTTLSGDGKLTTAIGASLDNGRSVNIQTDGKILVAGISYNGTNHDFALVRYNADGSLDTTFSGDGKLTTAIGTSYDVGYSVTVQSDGKILVAGYSSSSASYYDFALVRYNTDGSLDSTFSGDGILTTAIGSSNDYGRSVAVQTDGKILVAGDSYNGTPPRQNSCRLHRTTQGAAMKDGLGSIRTGIQGQGGGEVAAAGERSAGGGGARGWCWSGNPGALARGCAVQARPRAGLDCGRPA